jgi:rhodanese-related sulfurtransferase
VARKLLEHGFTRVYLLKGGWKEWVKANYPTLKGGWKEWVKANYPTEPK